MALPDPGREDTEKNVKEKMGRPEDRPSMRFEEAPAAGTPPDDPGYLGTQGIEGFPVEKTELRPNERLFLFRRVLKSKIEFVAVDKIHATEKADRVTDLPQPALNGLEVPVGHPFGLDKVFQKEGQEGFSLRLQGRFLFQPPDDAPPVFRRASELLREIPVPFLHHDTAPVSDMDKDAPGIHEEIPGRGKFEIVSIISRAVKGQLIEPCIGQPVKGRIILWETLQFLPSLVQKAFVQPDQGGGFLKKTVIPNPGPRVPVQPSRRHNR